MSASHRNDPGRQVLLVPRHHSLRSLGGLNRAARGLLLDQEAPMVSKVSNMQLNSEYRRRVAEAKRLRPVADPAYLAALAERVALAFGLPLKVARQRVERMAISARPRPSSNGFQDRGG